MLKGKLCVVLGGIKGTGKSIAKTFAREKCNIAFMDSDKQEGRKLRDEIEKDYGVECFFFHGNTESQEDLEFFAGGIIGQYEKVDVLINNVNIYSCNGVENCCYEKMNQVFNMGVSVPYFFTTLCKENFGEEASIVNLITGDDKGSEIFASESCPIKGSVESLMTALINLLEGKARVNCVTNGHEENGLYLEENLDIVNTVAFLCKKKGDFINDQIIQVEGAIIQTFIEYNQGGWDIKK